MSVVMLPASGRKLRERTSPGETLSQTVTMAWRALLKMLRTPEQFLDVTVQPLLFTAMFAYIFGGAIAGDVANYLPILIPGILAQTSLTASMATGTQMREDMDKGVFHRFRSLPMSRIAPLAGPMMADLLRFGIAATLTICTGLLMGYRPGRRCARRRGGLDARRRRRLVSVLDFRLGRDRGAFGPGRSGDRHDDYVPADVSVERLCPRGHPAELAAGVRAAQSRLADHHRGARPHERGHAHGRRRVGGAGLRRDRGDLRAAGSAFV